MPENVLKTPEIWPIFSLQENKREAPMYYSLISMAGGVPTSNMRTKLPKYGWMEEN